MAVKPDHLLMEFSDGRGVLMRELAGRRFHLVAENRFDFMI